MDFNVILTSIENLPFAVAIREVGTWFPWIESIHVLMICTVVGTIWIVDLRLLGWAWTSRGIKEVTNELLPFTWSAFAIAAITGSLLFTSRAEKYVTYSAFQLKMLLIVFAGLNMLYFHFAVSKDADAWDGSATPPANVRRAGAISLIIWLIVIVCGRWTGFQAEL